MIADPKRPNNITPPVRVSTKPGGKSSELTDPCKARGPHLPRIKKGAPIGAPFARPSSAASGKHTHNVKSRQNPVCRIDIGIAQDLDLDQDQQLHARVYGHSRQDQEVRPS